MGIATPSRYHCVLSFTGDGPQLPRVTFRVWPSTIVPVTWGTGARGSLPLMILPVLAEETVFELYPASLPVTFTQIRLPRSDAPSR